MRGDIELMLDDEAKLEGKTVRQFFKELNHFCDQGTGALKDITIPGERVRDTATAFTPNDRKRGGADTVTSKA